MQEDEKSIRESWDEFNVEEFKERNYLTSLEKSKTAENNDCSIFSLELSF